jgi:hypothetical protein
MSMQVATVSEDLFEAIDLCVRDAMQGVSDSRFAPDYAVTVAAWLAGERSVIRPNSKITPEAQK